jgi:RNA polymerase sigma-70 factor (ECF subfamily)
MIKERMPEPKMPEQNGLAQQFEENRSHLRAVGYRILGSLDETDDAIQETWLRLSRSDAAQIENLGGWLTTVLARVCLDMLRSRSARREQVLDIQVSAVHVSAPPGEEPRCYKSRTGGAAG